MPPAQRGRVPRRPPAAPTPRLQRREHRDERPHRARAHPGLRRHQGAIGDLQHASRVRYVRDTVHAGSGDQVLVARAEELLSEASGAFEEVSEDLFGRAGEMVMGDDGEDGQGCVWI